MNNICVLLDYTETARMALKRASELAIAKGAKVDILYITGKIPVEDRDVLLDDANNYVAPLRDGNVDFNIHLIEGSLNESVRNFINDNPCDLLISGTHGKKGIRQHLFGSAIYSLVRGVKVPTLVVNEKTPASIGGFKKILFPIGPHQDFEKKAQQVCPILHEDGKVLIFVIQKAGEILSKQTQKNIERSKEIFNEAGVNFEEMSVPSAAYSVGYSKQTLQFAKENGVDAIAVMSEVSSQNAHFGKVDKENVLLNTEGIATLCAN